MFQVTRQRFRALASVLLAGHCSAVMLCAVENNNYDSALSLGQGAVTWQGTNTGADVEEFEPEGPFGIRTGTVWCGWQATAAGWWTADTAGSDFDTVLALGTGVSMADYKEIAVNNDTPEGQAARIIFYAEAGESFQIAVGGAAGAEGQVHLSISPGAEPLPRVTAAELTIPATTVEVPAAEILTVELEVSSPDGFAWGEVRLCRENGGLASARWFNHRQRESGDVTQGIYRVPLELSPHLPPGTYFLEYQVVDWSENATESGMGRWSTVATGESVLKKVDITNTGTADFVPPVLSESSKPEPVDFAYGSGQAVFLLDVADDISGVHGGRMVFRPAAGGAPLEYSFSERELVSGSWTDGRYQVSCEIPQMTSVVFETEIVLYDRAGNLSVYQGENVVCANSQASFSDWGMLKGLSGTQSMPDSDPDHDGVVNTLEYAFGMDPGCPDTVHSQALRTPEVRYASDGSVTVDYTRRIESGDLEYHVEGSTGFTFDTEIPETATLWSDGMYERVRCQSALPGGAKTFFARIRVELLQF